MINLWAYSGWTAAGPWNPTAPNARVFEYVTETQRTGEWKARRGTTEIGRCTTSRDPFPFSMNEPWFVQPRHNVQTPYFYSRDASSSINGSRPCRDSLTPKRRPCNLSHLCEIFVHSLTTIFWEISEKTYIYTWKIERNIKNSYDNLLWMLLGAEYCDNSDFASWTTLYFLWLLQRK